MLLIILRIRHITLLPTKMYFICFNLMLRLEYVHIFTHRQVFFCFKGND